VAAVAKPRIPAILKLATWDDKQNAIDELYETVETQLKDREDILGRNPNFGAWVETALEEYLKAMNAEIQETGQETAKDTSSIDGEAHKGVGSENDDIVADAAEVLEQDAVVDDANADPIFMDLYDKEDGVESIVPKILHPLKPHARDGPGRMVEEWELSAHKETKRILLRQCTRQIARALNDNTSSRVYVHGRNGVGKVSSALRSQYEGIVLIKLLRDSHFSFLLPTVGGIVRNCWLGTKVRLYCPLSERRRSTAKAWQIR
jgi:hypothetical protein